MKIVNKAKFELLDLCAPYCDGSEAKNYSITDVPYLALHQSGPFPDSYPVLNTLSPRELKDGPNFLASAGDKLPLIIPRFLKRGLYVSWARRDQSLNGYAELRRKHVRDVL